MIKKLIKFIILALIFTSNINACCQDCTQNCIVSGCFQVGQCANTVIPYPTCPGTAFCIDDNLLTSNAPIINQCGCKFVVIPAQLIFTPTGTYYDLLVQNAGTYTVILREQFCNRISVVANSSSGFVHLTGTPTKNSFTLAGILPGDTVCFIASPIDNS